MTDPAAARHFESRWPVIAAILVVIGVLALLPGRLMLAPPWVSYGAGVCVLAPMLMVQLSRGGARWSRIERAIVLAFCLFAGGTTLANLANLIEAILYRPKDVGGLQLLSSSVGLWAVNVLLFSLIYWEIDRGGPETRTNGGEARPDWLFPQDGAPPEQVAPGWLPTFVDYLYLSFSTATAFSTTDAMPVTQRAKLSMMLESTISLMTIVIVASRAINVLGA